MHVCMKKSMKIFDQIVAEAIYKSWLLNLQEVDLRNFMQLA